MRDRRTRNIEMQARKKPLFFRLANHSQEALRINNKQVRRKGIILSNATGGGKTCRRGPINKDRKTDYADATHDKGDQTKEKFHSKHNRL